MDTAAEAHVRHLFRHAKEQARRRIPLGNVTHMAAITALPQWSEQAAKEVAEQIIEMTHVRTDRQKKELKEKVLKVSQRPIRLVGKALTKKEEEPNYLQRVVKRKREEQHKDKGKGESQHVEEEGVHRSIHHILTPLIIKCPHCENTRLPKGTTTIPIPRSNSQQ